MFEVMSNMLGLPAPLNYTDKIKQSLDPDGYFEKAKKEMLGIDQAVLTENDLVSRVIAETMATRALALTSADHAVALTGIAGPGGDGSVATRGELWIAWADKSAQTCFSAWFDVPGSRHDFRLAASALALQGLAQRLARSVQEGA